MNKHLVQNFTYLFFIKILLLVLPLVTFPYLLNTIKAEKYGIVMWLWAIADIFILCIRFGFDTFCVKLVSINRNKLNKLSKIFTTVIVLKLTIFSLSLVVLFFLYYCNQTISKNLSLFLFFIIYIFFESMLPIWYFQGIENIKFMSILVVGVKLFFTVFVFLFIHNIEDYILVPLFYSLGSILINIISYTVIFCRHKLFFSKFKLNFSIYIFTKSFHIFAASLGSILCNKGIILLIERFLGFESVAFFDISIKIVNIFLAPFHTLSQVLYPYIAKNKNLKLFKKIFIISLFISFSIVLLYVLNLNAIINIIYHSFNEELYNSMFVLIFLLPMATISALIGTNIIIVFDKTKWIIYSTLFGFILFAIVFLIIPHNILIYFCFLFLSFYFGEMMVRIFRFFIIMQEKK